MDVTSDPAAVAAELAAEGVRTVIFAGVDTHGVMRGKRIPIDQVSRVLSEGMPLCDVFWVMHIDESDLVPRPAEHVGYFPTERNGYPDILAIPDLSTLRRVPWHEDTALVLCDWHLLHHGGPVPIDPRGVLKGVVERARAMGFEPYSAMELEFYLLRETADTVAHRHARDLVPLQGVPSTYGVVLGSAQEPIARRIREQMLAYGIPIEACNPETGPGQFEINLRYGPCVQAADDAFLFKSGVKEIARQEGLLATFMAKPNAAWAGNSSHMHISLRSLTGETVFYDDSQPHGLSTTCRQFAAGVLAAMPELTALMAPTPNSYRRYAPYSWAGTTATWGIDNRSTGLRVICEGPAGTRLEQRQAGGDVNPYLATAAVLAAGLAGIEARLEPPPLTDADVYALDPGSVTSLPRSLTEAITALAASTRARQWLGADVIDHFVVLKEAELAAQARAVTDWEVARYLDAL